MKLLESYILRRIAQASLAAMLPVLAIIWVIQALGNVDLVTDSGQSISSFMLLATLILPTIIPAVLPFAVVIGVSQTLTAMNNDSELTVMDAAGASRSIILRPVILFAVAMSIGSFCVDNLVEPVVRVQARNLVAAAYADLLSAVIQEKSFRKVADGLYIQIDQRTNGRVLHGLFIADSRDPDSDLIYYAREGSIDESGTALIMRDGEVHRKAPDGKVSIIQFLSYSFDLTEMSKSRKQAALGPIDRDLAFLLNPDPKDQSVITYPTQYVAELHRRLTEWALPLIYALVALVFAGDARSHRSARLHPMVSALGVSFALRLGAFYLAYNIEANPSHYIYLYLFHFLTLAWVVGILIKSSRRRTKSWTNAVLASMRNRFANSFAGGQK
jgi:lipopolysaccharide export system permease protein